MPDDLTLTNFRQWHDARLKGDGTAEQVTKIRYNLGKHGPFDATFPRDVDALTIQQAIRDQRDHLSATLNVFG